MTNVVRATAMLLPPALAIIGCGNAMAYRPFDGTDASVAELDNVEVELGPIEYARAVNQRSCSRSI